MGFLDRLTRGRSPRRTSGGVPARERRRTPSFREMHARLRTVKAETKLLETEAKIHEEAARMRMQVRQRG